MYWQKRPNYTCLHLHWVPGAEMDGIAMAEMFRELRILIMYIQDDRFYALYFLLLVILMVRLMRHR